MPTCSCSVFDVTRSNFIKTIVNKGKSGVWYERNASLYMKHFIQGVCEEVEGRKEYMKEYILLGPIGHQPHSNHDNIEMGLVIVYLIHVIILLYKMQHCNLLIVYIGGALMRFLSVFYCDCECFVINCIIASKSER